MGSDNLILSLAKALENNIVKNGTPQKIVCEVSKKDNGADVLKVITSDGKETKIELVTDLLNFDKPFDKVAEEICKVIADDLKVSYEFKIL